MQGSITQLRVVSSSNCLVLLFQSAHVEIVEGGQFGTDGFGVGVGGIEAGESGEWLAEVREVCC